MELDEGLIGALIQRKQQIFACEAVAVPAAMIREPEVFYGTDIVWFIDDEAACSSLVRGATKEEDVAMIAAVTHLVMMHYKCRVWLEWIDAHSNPADGLSRDGCYDTWTRQQGWELRDVKPLQWSELELYVA